MPGTLDKKKLHINEAGGKPYPEPDVPVNNAWENMKQLLLQSPVVPATKPKLRIFKAKGFKPFIAGTGIAITVTVLTYVIAIKKEQTPSSKLLHSSDVVPKADTLQHGTIAFEFNNTPFKEAAGFIEKAYDVKIIVNNPKLYNCTITTRFDNKSLEEILDILGYTLAFDYKIDKKRKQVIISGDGCD